jgi:hypothetical protein
METELRPNCTTCRHMNRIHDKKTTVVIALGCYAYALPDVCYLRSGLHTHDRVACSINFQKVIGMLKIISILWIDVCGQYGPRLPDPRIERLLDLTKNMWVTLNHRLTRLTTSRISSSEEIPARKEIAPLMALYQLPRRCICRWSEQRGTTSSGLSGRTSPTRPGRTWGSKTTAVCSVPVVSTTVITPIVIGPRAGAIQPVTGWNWVRHQYTIEG